MNSVSNRVSMFLGFDPDQEYLESTARKAIKDQQFNGGHLVVEVHAILNIPNVQADDFFTLSPQEPYVYMVLQPDGVSAATPTTLNKQPVTVSSDRFHYYFNEDDNKSVLQLQLSKEVFQLDFQVWNQNYGLGLADDMITKGAVALNKDHLELHKRALFQLDDGTQLELTIHYSERHLGPQPLLLIPSIIPVEIPPIPEEDDDGPVDDTDLDAGKSKSGIFESMFGTSMTATADADADAGAAAAAAAAGKAGAGQAGAEGGAEEDEDTLVNSMRRITGFF